MKLIFDGSVARQRRSNFGGGIECPPDLERLPLDQIGLSDSGPVDLATLSAFWIDDAGRKRAAQDQPSWQALSCAWGDDLVLDDGTWRVATESDAAARVRAVASVPRIDFAEACAVAGIITWAEAAAWATGNDLPAVAQALVDAALEAERGPLTFRLLASPRVARTAPEILDLAASLSLTEAEVDELFGL